jgi:hypothetical protein
MVFKKLLNLCISLSLNLNNTYFKLTIKYPLFIAIIFINFN